MSAHYGRNEHQIACKAQERSDSYPPRREDVGTEAVVGAALTYHEQEARQNEGCGNGAKHIVRIFHKDSFHDYKHCFNVCSGK